MDIVLRNVCKAFGGKSVLRDFSHCFPGGKTSCILGPSGCGKTTLLGVICGLVQADSGEITGNRRRFSAVFQEDRLFDRLGAEKNVMLTAGPGFSREDARDLLVRLGIDDFAGPVGKFSGGMRRRTAIARALAAEYDVLLLDEPLSGLDGATRLQVLEVIKKMTAGKTVICVTHLPEDAAYLGGEILDFTKIGR